MTKFSLPKSEVDITRSSIRVPAAMLKKLDGTMERVGYNRKQRSKWIEAITQKFLQRSDAANLIAEHFIIPGSTEAIPVTISIDLNLQINNMISRVLEEEGARTDRSSVIRTAITQELMASEGMQLSPKETRIQQLEEIGGYDE